MITVTGAAGKTGQAVLRALQQRGETVRAWVRRPEQVEVAHRLGAQDVVVGDLQDPAILAQALDGARKVYLICPNMHPEEEAIGRAVLDQARKSGVQHIVYHSVLHPQTQTMPHHWHKLLVEEAIFESKLPFTVLQPAAYMQNLRGSWETILTQGLYRVPYAVETRLGMVDLLDVAEVAAKVLTEPGHEGAIYELAGPEVLTQEEVAGILGRALGRPVRVETISPAEWEHRARTAGLSDYARETLQRMFRYYEQFGFWGNPNVLAWLLGRPPTRLSEFVRRTAMTGDW